MNCVMSLVSFILIAAINVDYADHRFDSVKTRSGYTDSLNQVVKTLKENKTPGIELTEYSIPESAEEALLFFQLDHKKESTVEFRKLLEHINNVCLKGRETTIRKFILLSQFVDGYFAEDYFDSAEKICKNNPVVFCKIFHSIDVDKKQRLVDYNITCNKR